MEDDDKHEERTPSRGADWEVVSLTASTYAAAPGPEGFDLDDERRDKEYDRSEEEPSSTMFMSGHFVFPPSEHENLPIEEDCSGAHGEAPGQDESLLEEEGDGTEQTRGESRQVKPEEGPQGTQFFDNGNTLPVHATDFEEDMVFKGLDITTGFGSFHVVRDRSEFVPCPEGTEIGEPNDSPPVHTNANEEDEYDGAGLPCEAWWKRHAAYIYRHAKETNTFWSIFVAAALTGLVILGKRWQREKWEHKWPSSVNVERTMLGPIGRFKDIIIGSHQKSQLIGGAASANY